MNTQLLKAAGAVAGKYAGQLIKVGLFTVASDYARGEAKNASNIVIRESERATGYVAGEVKKFRLERLK